MSRIIIYPYKLASASSRALAASLRDAGAKVLRVYPNRNYRPLESDLIINWGNSIQPNWITNASYDQFLNTPNAVSKATNKLTTFQHLLTAQVPTPEWTIEKRQAIEWQEGGGRVFARTLLTGHSGSGIVVSQPSEDFIVDAPLYTLNFSKTHEYRVHVFKGLIIDVQEKRKRVDTGTRQDHDVWNYGNDYIFAREGIVAPTIVLEAAIKAVTALGLDFGAVDVGYNHREDTCAVFEVNTACGLEGTTLSKYTEVIYECQ